MRDNFMVLDPARLLLWRLCKRCVQSRARLPAASSAWHRCQHKMSQGVTTPHPPSSPFHQHSSVGCSECWLANAKFSLFLRYFFRLPSNKFFGLFTTLILLALLFSLLPHLIVTPIAEKCWHTDARGHLQPLGISWTFLRAIGQWPSCYIAIA